MAKFPVRILIIFLLVPALARADGVDCRIAHSAMVEASKIRHLAIKSKVPCTIENREQVKEFLLNAVQSKIPAQKMRSDELIAKALGFIPEDYDYKTGLVNLYLSQLGGYYDPEHKKYVMAGWLPEMMQPVVAAHELTHALQDQHFNLETFIDDKLYDTDKLLARAALVEGDATAVMLDYQRGLLGQQPLAKEEKVDSFILQTVLGMALTTTNNPAPESIKAALLFPYASGIRFVHHLLREGGYEEVSRVFLQPPDTTEEILHPEKYKKKEYRRISDEDIGHEAGYADQKYSDSLGEFSVSALLSGGTVRRDLAASAAAGWGGDRVTIFNKEKKEFVLWKSYWDSSKDAQEFFSAYREFLIGQGSAVGQNKENSLEVKVDSRSISLVLREDAVIVRVDYENSLVKN